MKKTALQLIDEINPEIKKLLTESIFEFLVSYEAFIIKNSYIDGRLDQLNDLNSTSDEYFDKNSTNECTDL